MTTEDILALTPFQLPAGLAAHGLHPASVIMLTWPPSVCKIKTPDGGLEMWRPQSLILHAWPLVETWGLTIAPSDAPTCGAW